MRSKRDVRWNGGGNVHAPVELIAGKPAEADAHLEKCRQLYGEPPEDLEFVFTES